MADRLSQPTVPGVPLAGSAVQLGNLVGLLVEQVRPQHVGEEVVIAVPLPALIERDEKKIPPLQRRQGGPATVLSGDGVAAIEVMTDDPQDVSTWGTTSSE